jgi:hypothetical protein
MLKLARPFLCRPVREENVVLAATSVGNVVAVRKTIRLFPNRWFIIVVINERKTLEFCTNRAMRERRSIIRESLHARLHGESSILRLFASITPRVFNHPKQTRAGRDERKHDEHVITSGTETFLVPYFRRRIEPREWRAT